MNAYNNLKHTFESKRIRKDIKIRVLNTYVKSIFMYNSELWTLTKELEKEIDVFQRTLLRKILHIYWQDKVTNKELYARANSTEWSHEIKKKKNKKRVAEMQSERNAVCLCDCEVSLTTDTN